MNAEFVRFSARIRACTDTGASRCRAASCKAPRHTQRQSDRSPRDFSGARAPYRIERCVDDLLQIGEYVDRLQLGLRMETESEQEIRHDSE
jgi:hypothetical protein